MALVPGTRLGPYEVVALIGCGGMGEVYRARDTGLGRHVALKILPDTFTNDRERLARFRREAQVLASLNHPHIAAIYGLDEVDGVLFLVLELVDGETLTNRIDRGRLPVDEALAIASQIAEALEAAHEKGIVHRDLKPANIALTSDGRVKVLDFGLAKAIDPMVSGDLANSPTLTSPAVMTGVGALLGTAAYMAPEQAKGRPADKRSDIWAFGCVLYEMLTGRRVFDGEDVTDTIAAIVRAQPDWTTVPPSVPESIRLLLRSSLEKDRNARISDIAVARFLLAQAQGGAPPSSFSPRQAWQHGPAARATLVGLVAGAAATGAAAWALLRPAPPAPRQTARFALVASGLQALRMQATDRNVDISRDGAFIVYRGAGVGGLQLFVRSLGDLDARQLDATTDPRSPFISPDGRWVGYFSGLELKRAPVAGGPPITLSRVPATSRGASWGTDGTIVFATAERNGGLMTVPEAGGEAQVLIKPDLERLDPTGPAYDFPSVLPGGSAVLFTIGPPGGAAGQDDRGAIAVLNRKTGEHKTLVRGGSQAQYVAGYLIYGRFGSLYAVRFDLGRLDVVGEPVRILQDVLMTTGGAANFAVSQNGSLVYIPASASTQAVTLRSLVWVNRQGREEPLGLPERAYADPRLSPDGTRIAVGIRDQRNDIWIGDLRRNTLTPLTFDPTVDQAPVWTPDGAHIVWCSQRGTGVPTIYMQAADGTGAIEQLTATLNPQFPTSVSPDGARLVLWENNPRTTQDIVMVDLRPAAAQRERPLQPLVHTPAAEMDGEVSPDGRWLAYESNESGRFDVYVRPFPNVDSGRWLVSTAGGTRPLWSRNGRELFYLDADDFLTAVPVQTLGSAFRPGNPVRLLSKKYYPGFTALGLDLRGYDVSPDGQRFLMLKDAAPAQSTQPSGQLSASMIVVLNWIDEVNARVPLKQR
jgi:serine/threonine-protein kinase